MTPRCWCGGVIYNGHHCENGHLQERRDGFRLRAALVLVAALTATSALATPIDCGNDDNDFSPSDALCHGQPKALNDWFLDTYGARYVHDLESYIPDGLGPLGSKLWLYGFERGYYAELTGHEWEGPAHHVDEPQSPYLMIAGVGLLVWLRWRKRNGEGE